jgi:hypothetical protein
MTDRLKVEMTPPKAGRTFDSSMASSSAYSPMPTAVAPTFMRPSLQPFQRIMETPPDLADHRILGQLAIVEASS